MVFVRGLLTLACIAVAYWRSFGVVDTLTTALLVAAIILVPMRNME